MNGQCEAAISVIICLTPGKSRRAMQMTCGCLSRGLQSLHHITEIMNTKSIQISPDCTMQYSDVGQGSPVVLLHAFPLSCEAWAPQIEALQENFRVIAPSQRGFGGTSPFVGTPSIAQMADDVAALLDALEVSEPVTLGGLSMGGYVSLNFARKYPERLRGLLLCDTKAEGDTPEAKAKRGEMIEFAGTHSTREVVEKLLPTLTGETTRAQRPEVVEEVLRIGAANPRDTIIAALQALRDRPDASGWLGSINVPALVVVGSEDTITPPAIAQSLAERIPGATLSVIDGAGHLANMEQPDAFNDAVGAFLELLR